MKPLQQSTFGRFHGLIIALSMCWLLSLSAVARAEDTPLKMDGKSTLYQRVLTLPKAKLMSQPGQQDGELLVTFSRYYVYQRKTHQDQEWLLVGPDRFGKTVGWVAVTDTVEWKTQLTLLLTNPANRQQLLFFDSAETLDPLIESEQGGQKVADLAQQLELSGAAKGVVSREPEYSVDFQNNFYLIPVLSAEERYLYDGNIGQLLQIASVSAKADPEPAVPADPKPAQTEQRLLRGFSAAIVFVIDSTISMGPYIERTREAVKSIYEKIELENLLNNVKFGLVAYRSNLQASAKLEYVTRFFADPDEIKNSEDFLDHVAALKPASVSTARFDEDAFAGVMQALNEVTWTDFGGRYLVLITDAGALQADDPLSATRLSAKSVRMEAEYRGVALYTLHLKTPQGRKNHASAEAQYTELSFNKILNKPLYHGVEAGNVQAFGDVVEKLSEAMVGTVKQAYAGQTVAGSAAAADPRFGREEEETSKATQRDTAEDEGDQLVEDTRLLGHAMKLEYLGQLTGSQVPDSFKAWIVDRDLQNTSQKTVEARVLLSKSQLSDLSEVVQEIYQAASDSIIAPDTFFNRLSSLAATMGRDPNQLTESKSTKLVELGLLGEYLQDIPYFSDVMGLDSETWESWSASQQDSFIRGLGNKLRYYQLYNQDVDRWISLAEGSDPRDHVYPVPLEALP